MSRTFKSLPTAIGMILKDPINFTLAVIPALIALTLYIVCITLIINNYDLVVYFIKDQIRIPAEYTGWVGAILTGLMVIFVFIVMNWTFIMVVGIIGAPFNSMISTRIERKLAGKQVEENKSRTYKEMFSSIGSTLINELKKMILILVLSFTALLLNLIPFMYPVALFIFCMLIAIQFVDYTWSRHDWGVGKCMGDLMSGVFSYSFSGLGFLGLMMVPVINAFIPPLATSYYTVLWLHRQNKILATTQTT